MAAAVQRQPLSLSRSANRFSNLFQFHFIIHLLRWKMNLKRKFSLLCSLIFSVKRWVKKVFIRRRIILIYLILKTNLEFLIHKLTIMANKFYYRASWLSVLHFLRWKLFVQTQRRRNRMPRFFQLLRISWTKIWWVTV